MSGGLRYRSVEDMPAGLARRLPAQARSTSSGAARRPSRKRKDEEHNAQVVFFNRVRTLALNDPPGYARAARRTFAVPNGGGRSKAEAGRLKAEGVTAGVPDICCALPRLCYHGLWIELKRPPAPGAKGRVSPEQQAFIDESLLLGYHAAVCHGEDEAWDLWLWYVGLPEQGR
ncbi:MAG TPA: VRR-NUC domain-containing protein [Rhodanobacteraceae bacterium]|nr:VRR-NUC domain-containing protein [Rhodanobacteraceae bacterium]